MAKSRAMLESQAFVVLTEEQIALLRPFGEERATRAGDVLFEVGDAGYNLVVVLAGETAILDRADGEDRVIKVSKRGEFHGELNLLSGEIVFAACVVREPGAVLLVSPARLREIIATVPALSDILVPALAARRQILMQSAAATLTIIGDESARPALAIEEFADRNRIPHRSLAPGDPAAEALLARAGRSALAGVQVVVHGSRVLDDPSPLEVARALGLALDVAAEEPADLLVVGTGPAGLAAAVYGASEGLRTIAVENVAIGGQAGTSSRIENYLGFPSGISGGDLAFLAEVQALKFGARIAVPRRAARLEPHPAGHAIHLDDGKTLVGRSVIVATGARYRWLGLPREEELWGAGIYYAATEMEARFCRDAEVVIVGAGNSAGQAALFLAGHARRTHLICRGPDLARSMSHYLTARLEAAPNVRIHTDTRVAALDGDERLTGLTIARAIDGATEAIPARALFVMIGADPCTDWLADTLALDRKGFVATGPAVAGAGGGWSASPYATSLPGVFAVGDVRADSVKRVASAVGEGSVVVQAVHQYLAALETVEGAQPAPAAG